MIQTTWDKIYKAYEKGGEKWASLADKIHPAFISYLSQTKFQNRSVLDLGCGNGKYLKLLKKVGFSISGIDSSPTAIKMARRSLGIKAKLYVKNIYTTPIQSGKYDFIISIATIQHSKKPPIKRLVNRIYKSLLPDGKVFITFPRMSSLQRWAIFTKMKKIASGTFVPLLGPEKGLPHSFYEKDELMVLFSRFDKVRITKDNKGRWIVRGMKKI
jgi:2-polyprenyl-3-methyl-5-hydroxy-6-metoxy-1,4-benzoquinol methylase